MFCALSYILVPVAVTLGFPEDNSTVKETSMPSPRIYGISTFQKEGPIIHWLLDEKSEDEPVLGYKVKLWQVGCDKKPKYTVVGDKRVRLKNVMAKLRDYSTLRNLTEFTVAGEDHTRLFLEDIEHDVPYHVSVTAFSAAGEGPPSSPFRFQYRGGYTCREI